MLFEILVPMCRPKGHLGENERAVSAARSSIWTSIGVVFSWFSLPGVISGRVFFTMCCQRGFKCFPASLFHFQGAANLRKCGQITVGSFKNTVWENTTKRRHSIILELPMLRYGHILESFWQAILRKNMKKDIPEKHVFLKKLKILVREL